MHANWKEKTSPGLQQKYSESFLQLSPTISPSECHSTVSNFKTELISLRAEPYYVIYRLYPPGRLSGGWLADAVRQFLPLSSALKGSESEGQPERRAAAPQGWSQRAQCRPAGGTHSGQTSEVWQRCTIIPELLMPGNRLGRRQPERRGSFASEGLTVSELKRPETLNLIFYMANKIHFNADLRQRLRKKRRICISYTRCVSVNFYLQAYINYV